MKTRSMTTFQDNLPRYRRQYAAMRTKRARTRLLDALVASHRFERKYLIKLLRGQRNYKPRRGRGPTYTEDAKRLLAALWRAADYPCAEYLKPMLPKLAADYAALGNPVDPDALKQLQVMSPSTIGRSIRGRSRPAARRRNKHAGLNTLKKSILECPGSHLPEDAPGTCQLDTVLLCGGDLRESYFGIATLTDAATQWFECAPAWNHGAEATTRATHSIHARLPFAMKHLHPDNGPEFINHLFVNAMKKHIPGLQLSRSRAYRKNDNCRIEQKNGSIVRDYFGDLRFDRFEQYAALERVCRDISLHTNLFRPCKKLVTKERKDCKGVKYRKTYDAPRTPLNRLLIHPVTHPTLPASYQHQRDTLNSITLSRSIHSQLRALFRGLRGPPAPGGGAPAAGGTRNPRKIPFRSVSTHLTDAPRK
jgi:hypothetical protein